MKVKFIALKDLRSKKPAEITKYVAELKHAKAELQHGITTNKEKQTHLLGQIKSAIARAHTISTEQQASEKENR